MSELTGGRKYRILVVEDHADTRRFLEALLGKEYEVIAAENGVLGIDYARNRAPDLILLDIMLPVLNGFDACSLLRQDDRTKRIPILFLSAKNTVNDITQGLGLGADDYISKPFDHKELMARIQVRLRKPVDPVAEVIQIGDLRIDPSERQVSFADKIAKLTLTEFDLIRFLAFKAGDVVTREEIRKEIWKDGAEDTNDRTIDVHIRALRKKIPALSRHLTSVYGVGYKYEK